MRLFILRFAACHRLGVLGMPSEIMLRHHDFLLCIIGDCGTRTIVSNSGLNPGATNDYVQTAL